MKAYCPNNCKQANFITCAHVVEDWIVSATGDWIETIDCTQISHGPDTGNSWTCTSCGEAAKFLE